MAFHSFQIVTFSGVKGGRYASLKLLLFCLVYGKRLATALNTLASEQVIPLSPTLWVPPMLPCWVGLVHHWGLINFKMHHVTGA